VAWPTLKFRHGAPRGTQQLHQQTVFNNTTLHMVPNSYDYILTSSTRCAVHNSLQCSYQWHLHRTSTLISVMYAAITTSVKPCPQTLL